MLKLNKFEEDYERVFKRAPKVLAKREPQISDTSLSSYDRQQATFVVTSKYIELAYLNYWLEKFDQVKPILEKAAPYALLRGFDEDLKTHNNEWTIQEELNICLLFGDDIIRNQLIDITEGFKTHSITREVLFLYDQLLLRIGTGQTIEPTLIQEALDRAQTSKDKDVLQLFLPLIEAIIALINDDKPLWQSSIDKVIAWHTDECKFGDYKDTTDGFMNLNALTMAKLGKDMHGWECETDSVYLPLFLIA